jgi:hypothetical protein
MISSEWLHDMRKLMVASLVSLDGVVEGPMAWAGCIRPIGLHEYCVSISRAS